MIEQRHASVAVVGAGDYIGAAIARRFAREGYLVHAGRRNGEKLAPLVEEIAAFGGRCVGLTLDARQEEAVTRSARGIDVLGEQAWESPQKEDRRGYNDCDGGDEFTRTRRRRAGTNVIHATQT